MSSSHYVSGILVALDMDNNEFPKRMQQLLLVDAILSMKKTKKKNDRNLFYIQHLLFQ